MSEIILSKGMWERASEDLEVLYQELMRDSSTEYKQTSGSSAFFFSRFPNDPHNRRGAVGNAWTFAAEMAEIEKRGQLIALSRKAF